MNGATKAMRARVAEGVERTRLWEALTAKHANYAGYQRKTSRQIPVVVLEPPKCLIRRSRRFEQIRACKAAPGPRRGGSAAGTASRACRVESERALRPAC